MIEFRNVTKKYQNGTEALKDVNLKIRKGEFVFIVGASGAGKSTFLKLMMLEEKPSSGEIIVDGFFLSKLKRRQVPFLRRKMGIVFQDFRLIPKMSVYDNVAFAMRVVGTREKTVQRHVLSMLELVGLTDKMKCYPNELSGGEQQRVSLARALVNNPAIIIADEPTGNIDPERSFEIVELLSKINQRGTTVIMVTHEHDLVRKFDQRVIVIENGLVVCDAPQNMGGRSPKAGYDKYLYHSTSHSQNRKFSVPEHNYQSISEDFVFSDEFLILGTDLTDAQSGGIYEV